MPLVQRIAHHLSARLPASVQVEDLIQAGAIGLLEAVSNFDQRHGASFATYAGIRIRGAMMDEVRRHGWSPRSAYREARQIAEAVNRVESRLQREATAAAVAAELEVDVERYQQMLRRVTESRMLSLEVLTAERGDGWEGLESGADDPAAARARQDIERALAEAIAALPEREQLVMSLYYDEELNLREIGEVLGVTESRVSQLHGQALARLRTIVSARSGEAGASAG